MPPTEIRRTWPSGERASRQYQVTLASGHTVTLGFSLADPDDSTTARVREAHCASHVGLFVVRGDPESVEEVLLWIQQTTSISLFSQTALVVGHEVRALLPRYFAVFFDEVKDLAPDLAMVRPIAPKTGDKKLN